MLEDSEGTFHRVVKLRDPWSREVWEGGNSAASRVFWSKIIASYDRK